MLHITNGDGAADLLLAAGMQGTILPWRDILHEGPVPAGLDIGALSEIRAQFLAGQGWGTLHTLREAFAKRDAELQQFHRHGQVVLWFEHDLYDQLQIAQILDWFAGQNRGSTSLAMICIDRYPGVDGFRGLGDLTPKQIEPLFNIREPVTQAQLDLAETVWRAFRNPDPTVLESLLGQNTGPLPFVGAAIRRHIQQFPSVFNGLGRTEHHALSAVASGVQDAASLLRAHWAQEESPFLGDWAFWAVVKKLADGPYPLLHLNGPRDDDSFAEVTVTTTDVGHRVLEGQSDFVTLNGLDCWLGGVHYQGFSVPWRLDTTTGSLVRI